MKLGTRWAATAVALAVLSSCDNLTGPASTPEVDSPVLDGESLGPGIHPVLVVQEDSNGRLLDLYLVQVGEGDRAAAFQGNLSLPRDGLEVTAVQAPSGVMVAWNTIEPGLVRMAAIALDGFPDGPVVTLHVEGRAELSASQLEVTIEELASHVGFRGLTEQLVEYRHPLLSRVPPVTSLIK